MVIFKILMIILVALPPIGLAAYLYGQVVSFVRDRNRAELERNKKRKAAARAARAAERAEKSGGR